MDLPPSLDRIAYPLFSKQPSYRELWCKDFRQPPGVVAHVSVLSEAQASWSRLLDAT
jgi:hypothetical protein